MKQLLRSHPSSLPLSPTQPTENSEEPKMSERQRSMVSVLIQEAIDQKLIKAADPDNKSKKFAEYVPIWA
jgi:hypothetical protein